MYIEDEIFNSDSFREIFVPAGSYENCKFINCDFSEYDISGTKFIECAFHDCNLSNVKTFDAVFNTVQFKRSKLLGLKFDSCNDLLFTVTFDDCKLNHASFHGLDIKNTLFENSDLTAVDFTKANLTNAQFSNCNLLQATFFYTNLEGCNFSSSYNYAIDPEENKIRKAIFDMSGVLGLLAKHDIIIR